MPKEAFIKKSYFHLEGQTSERRDIKLGLDRMKMAIDAMGLPCKETPAIQIAGTNGKGSISSFINSILTTVGIKTGITTSPHLVDWIERICINNKQIPIKEFDLFKKNISPIVDKYELTPFESIIAIALKYFSSKSVEILILEVGLGGRLDATTSHSNRPIIALGAIGLDHCEYLGDSLEQIAKEKAAVITPRSTVITANQHPIVNRVIKATVERQNAKIHWVNPLSNDWELGIPGLIQRENAAVAKGAIESLKAIGWNISENDIRKGLSIAKWPARLQKCKWQGMPVVLDGAHNPHAAKQLSIERDTWKDQASGVIWILGIQKQKDVKNILNYLLKKNDIAWIVPIPGHNSWSKEQILDYCPKCSSTINEATSVQEVLSILLKTKKWVSPPPVIAGSLYLIGDLFDKKLLDS